MGRRGSVWFEPPGGASTEVLTLVYFDATDYRHYSSTRPLATRPPGVVDAAAHDVAGSRALRDWLDDSDDGGPGSLVQSLQHVDDPDGAPLTLRGGLQRSEVDRVYQLLVDVCDRTTVYLFIFMSVDAESSYFHVQRRGRGEGRGGAG